MLRAWALVALVLIPRVEDWKVAVADYAWSFPRDHWAHDGYRTEWWYFTGHLEGARATGEDAQAGAGGDDLAERLGGDGDVPRRPRVGYFLRRHGR